MPPGEQVVAGGAQGVQVGARVAVRPGDPLLRRGAGCAARHLCTAGEAGATIRRGYKRLRLYAEVQLRWGGRVHVVQGGQRAAEQSAQEIFCEIFRCRQSGVWSGHVK